MDCQPSDYQILQSLYRPRLQHRFIQSQHLIFKDMLGVLGASHSYLEKHWET